MITIFENYNNDDLKKIGEVVYCIKNYITKTASFNEGKYYTVDGLSGDSERAINDGLNYLPLKYTYGIILLDNNNNIVRFKNNKLRGNVAKYPDFFKYFEIPTHVADSEKYNL